jgi:hypothetical protein
MRDDGGDGADGGQALRFGELIAQIIKLFLCGSDLALQLLVVGGGGAHLIAHDAQIIGAPGGGALQGVAII